MPISQRASAYKLLGAVPTQPSKDPQLAGASASVDARIEKMKRGPDA